MYYFGSVALNRPELPVLDCEPAHSPVLRLLLGPGNPLRPRWSLSDRTQRSIPLPGPLTTGTTAWEQYMSRKLHLACVCINIDWKTIFLTRSTIALSKFFCFLTTQTRKYDDTWHREELVRIASLRAPGSKTHSDGFDFAAKLHFKKSTINPFSALILSCSTQ